MALLVMTKGIGEVYVATVPDDSAMVCVTHAGTTRIDWEKCGKDEELDAIRRENELLRAVILKAYRQFGDVANRRGIA